MGNQAIIDDLNRIKKAVAHRAPRWEPLDTALKEAEDAAFEQVRKTAKEMGGSMNLDWPTGLQALFRGAVAQTRINGLSALALTAGLVGPIIHGFAWFQAIFKVVHGRTQRAYSVVDSAIQARPTDYFGQLLPPSRWAMLIGGEIDRLNKAIAAEKADLSKPDADKAISAMLLAPMLYPPSSIPSAKTIALQIEWYVWQIHLGEVAENIRHDAMKAKVIENPPKTRLDPLFKRFDEILMNAFYQAGASLPGSPHTQNLETLRKGLESGKFRKEDFYGHDLHVDIKIQVSFPPKVVNYLNATGFEERQKVYLSAQRMTFAEAAI